MSLEILIGGAPIQPEQPNPIILEDNNSKWNNCKYRSDLIDKMVRTSCPCGSSNLVKMYVCNLLNVDNLNPVVCQNCELYQAKS